MKKILYILCIALLPIITHAENMCVKDGSVMVVLDPQIGGTALSSSNTGKTWSVQFNYGVVSGIGACGDENIAQGAVATNQNNLSPYTWGLRCFCKMLKPIESLWVYSGYDPGYADQCNNYCAQGCKGRVPSNVVLRQGLFGNILH